MLLTSRRWEEPRLLLVFAAACVAVLFGVATAIQPRVTIVVVLGAAAFAGCVALPVRWLPPLALVSALILPYEVTRWPVALIPMALWGLRSTQAQPGSRLLRWGAAALGGWLLLAASSASVQSPSGYIWLVVALCSIVLPALRGSQLPDPQQLKNIFLGLTTALAGFAVIETFLLKANPLYGQLYAAGGDPIVQGHLYRATTLLGHPLINGAIFATAAVFAVDSALERNAPRGSLLRLLILLSGLGATVSRGSTAAAVLGIGLLILMRRGRTTSLLRKLAVALAMVFAGIVFVGDLAARNSSSEGQRSTLVRGRLVDDTKRALKGHELLGVGPGDVESYREKFGLFDFDPRSQNTPKVALESTYAELVVGIGIPGLVLFLVIIFGAVARALRTERLVGPASALLTYALALGTFKTEGHVQLLVVLGLLLALTTAREPRWRSAIGRRNT